MMKKQLTMLGAMAVVCLGVQTTTAQFFTNDLTDASSIPADFTENISPLNNSVWSYTNDYALAEDGTTNTVLQGGGIIDWVNVDDDTARSYLATVNSNYLDYSWTAHVAVEAPASTTPWIYVGLGTGEPYTGYYHEPREGQSVYLNFQSGASSRKIKITDNTGSVLEDTGAWQGDPGYDFYLTFNHLTKTLKFEVDNWNGGRFSDIDVETTELAVGSILTDTNDAHIFFGSNAKVTWGDFEVYEIETTATPTTPLNLYAWPETNDLVTVRWDEETLSTLGYNLYRSLDNVDSNYVEIATGIMTNIYIDTAVTVGTSYYYKVAGTNDIGESGLSNSEMAIPNEYYIFGEMIKSDAAKDRWFYELFDGNLDTFLDDYANGGYAALDYGVGNEQEIVQIAFRLRNDGWGNIAETLVIDGVSNSVTRSQLRIYENTFEGSQNGVDWTVLATITNIPDMVEWNQIAVNDPTLYRYVRYNNANSWENAVTADVAFLKDSDFTSNGTLIPWLEQYGLTEADDEEDNDLDGLLSWEEYIAGTVPTDSNSVLKVNSFMSTTNGLVLSWQSVEGKSYSIITNTSLTAGTPGAVATGIAGEAGETSYTGMVSGASAVFYEVGVE